MANTYELPYSGEEIKKILEAVNKLKDNNGNIILQQWIELEPPEEVEE